MNVSKHDIFYGGLDCGFPYWAYYMTSLLVNGKADLLKGLWPAAMVYHTVTYA